MRAIQNHARLGLNVPAAVWFAVLALSQSASPSVAATRLTSHQVAELNACLDQQNKKVTAGPDHCAAFVAPARRHGRVTLTSGELDRMSECSDEQSGSSTEGAGDNCAEFARWARAHR